jgi:hypothetical protein
VNPEPVRWARRGDDPVPVPVGDILTRHAGHGDCGPWTYDTAVHTEPGRLICGRGDVLYEFCEVMSVVVL